MSERRDWVGFVLVFLACLASGTIGWELAKRWAQ